MDVPDFPASRSSVTAAFELCDSQIVLHNPTLPLNHTKLAKRMTRSGRLKESLFNWVPVTPCMSTTRLCKVKGIEQDNYPYHIIEDN
jgi:hypothetical protein